MTTITSTTELPAVPAAPLLLPYCAIDPWLNRQDADDTVDSHQDRRTQADPVRLQPGDREFVQVMRDEAREASPPCLFGQIALPNVLLLASDPRSLRYALATIRRNSGNTPGMDTIATVLPTANELYGQMQRATQQWTKTKGKVQQWLDQD